MADEFARAVEAFEVERRSEQQRLLRGLLGQFLEPEREDERHS